MRRRSPRTGSSSTPAIVTTITERPGVCGETVRKGKDVILEIEIQGALEIKRKYPTALLLFVMPPSAAELRKRLQGRGTESPEVIAKRLKRAGEEAEGIEQYDFLVINDKLEECVQQMHELIRAAHYAPLRNEEMIQNMRKELREL